MSGPIVVMMPVFNDWKAFERLLTRLDAALRAAGLRASVIAVDDGSIEPAPAALDGFGALEEVHVLTLRRNVGHQRAIAIGLAFAQDRFSPHSLVVMDCDGEDNPSDVPRLLEKLEAENHQTVIFAERARRSESWTFRFCYALYRIAHRIVTGRGVRFGNFSAVPACRLEALVAVGELWNHYAAAVVKSRQPYTTIPTVRATRLDGRSSMNFVDLVVHGLSAISVHADVVGVRLLFGTAAVMTLMLIALAATVSVRLFTTAAIPGWTTYTVGILMVLLCQAALLSGMLTFMTLNGRQAFGFLPLRDYSLFVKGITRVYPLGDNA